MHCSRLPAEPHRKPCSVHHWRVVRDIVRRPDGALSCINTLSTLRLVTTTTSVAADEGQIVAGLRRALFSLLQLVALWSDFWILVPGEGARLLVRAVPAAAEPHRQAELRLGGVRRAHPWLRFVRTRES